MGAGAERQSVEPVGFLGRRQTPDPPLRSLIPRCPQRAVSRLWRGIAGTRDRVLGPQTLPAPPTIARELGRVRSRRRTRHRHGRRELVAHAPPWRRAMRPIAATTTQLRRYLVPIRSEGMDS